MTTLLLTSLAPLILFAIINYYTNLRQGVISGIITAMILAAISHYYFDYFDFELVVMIVLLVVMGFWSIYSQNELYFKLQPAITSLVSVLILVWYQLFDVPFALKFAPKLAATLPAAQYEILTSVDGQALLARISAYSIVWILIHGVVLAWAARYKSTATWLTIKALFLPYFFVTIIATEYAYQQYAS